MADKENISVAEYARRLRIHVNSVKKKIQSGVIQAKLGPEGNWYIEVDKELAPGVSHKVEQGEISQSTTNRLLEARIKKEQANAEIRKMELDERAGLLVDAKKVSRDAFNEGRRVRDALLSIPSKIAPELAAEIEPEKVEIILNKIIREALEGLVK
jgi:phage terminase Nu1 subunit (DNA packaging protein)